MFPIVLTRIMCSTTRNFFNWWSLSLFSWSLYLIQKWNCKEKLLVCHSKGLKGKNNNILISISTMRSPTLMSVAKGLYVTRKFFRKASVIRNSLTQHLGCDSLSEMNETREFFVPFRENPKIPETLCTRREICFSLSWGWRVNFSKFHA